MARNRKKQSKRHLQTVALFSGVIFLSLLVCFSIVKAGSLDSSSAPAATMYTLQDIYTRLTTNAAAGSHNLGPSASPAATMYTLTEIYNAIPAIDASKVKLGTPYLGVDGTLVPSGGDAATSQVCSGSKFFGVSQANWTLNTGTLSIDADKMLTTATYCGTTGTYDTTNLVAGNVKSGVTFGVSSTGTLLPNDGTAAVADLFNGKTANLTADWTPDIGTLNLACNVSTFNGTINLVADTYDGGGIGSNRWCMTSSTNGAVATDIATDKKAWVSGIELTGTGIIETGTGTGSVATASEIASNYYAWGSDGAVVQGGGTLIIPGSPTGSQATTSQIPTGYYAYSPAGALLQGAASLGTDQSGLNGSLTITIPAGFYASSKTATASDTNLLSNYIKDNVSIFGVTGNIGLPKTGQTTSYPNGDATDRDDGHYQSGAPHSPQAWFTDNANGTITDNATGLMWKKCTEGLSGDTCATGTATAMVWDSSQGTPDAISTCEALNFASHEDWRLPNVKELQSIVDYSTVAPAINATYFPASQSVFYWSSTTYADDTVLAWVVHFYDGYVYFDSKGSPYYVRCVRQ